VALFYKEVGNMKTLLINKKNFFLKNVLSYLLFLGPALIFYITFLLIPVIVGMGYSLTDWNGLNPNYNFVGLENFIEAVTEDKHFLNSIFFTMKYVVVIVVLQNVIALLFAALICSRCRTKSFFKVMYFMPNMISLIIGSYVWQFIFKKVTWEIADKTIFTFLGQAWLGNPNMAFWAIVIVSLWTGVGYTTIIYIAAIEGVPQALKEASWIDGAGKVVTFFRITLPMIMYAITINLFLTLNGAFKNFDQIYGLTGGGPGRATQVMSLNIYEEAFSNFFRYGYANAKAIILFLFVLIVTLIQIRMTKRKEVNG
jgi:raffinose/stachyose/melibiose transport system permease protein